MDMDTYSRMESGHNKSFNEIENLSKHGAELVKNGKLARALHAFDSAYKASLDFGDGKTEQTCAFNFGAVYIVLGYPEKGLEMLRIAEQLIDSNNSSTSNGDLYFNFGLAYECLQNKDESIKYFELAKECYEKEDDSRMLADSCVKLGYLYSQQQQYGQASISYAQAARNYGIDGDTRRQVSSKCEQAMSLFNDDMKEEASNLVEECLEKCSKINNAEMMEFLYNDLGLAFTQCRLYTKAEVCFSLGLPASRRPNGDERQEAVLLQNLGAIYNFLGDYQRSLGIHEQAVVKYAKLKNRVCQGQCFSNLAFAYCQLGQFENATEAFLHAHQAAKDTGDHHARWQALEGLACVASNQGQLEKSVRLFKQSLTVLSQAAEAGTGVQDRIVAKLTKTLEAQIKGTSESITVNQPVYSPQILTPSVKDSRVNGFGDLPVYPAAVQTNGDAEEAPARLLATRPVSRPFMTIPRGLSLDSLVSDSTEKVRVEAVVPATAVSRIGGKDVLLLNQSAALPVNHTAVNHFPANDIQAAHVIHNTVKREEEKEIHRQYEEQIRQREMQAIDEEDSEDSETESEESSEYEEEEVSGESEDEDSDERDVKWTLAGGNTSMKQEERTPDQAVERDTVVKHVESSQEEVVMRHTEKRLSFKRDEPAVGGRPQRSDSRAIPGPLLDVNSPTSSPVIERSPRAVASDTDCSRSDEGSDYESDDISAAEDSDEDEDWNRSKNAAPGLPKQSPPQTLQGTYEQPRIVAGENSSSRTPRGTTSSPPYAEIDFSKSGRPITTQGSEKGQSTEDNSRSNFFHSDDDGRIGYSSQTGTYKDDEENPYETIRPRDLQGERTEREDWSQLPRGARERLMYKEHQRRSQAAEETKSETENSGSKTCTVM